jgi:molecular chaperone DnaJ
LHIRVKADPQMERRDHDVLSTAQVPFSLLALGGEWEVETLDGKSSIKIPEGTPAGTSFTLRGKGIVFSRSGNRGNHIVQVVPETPKKLSKEQRKMLEDLRGANL